MSILLQSICYGISTICFLLAVYSLAKKIESLKKELHAKRNVISELEDELTNRRDHYQNLWHEGNIHIKKLQEELAKDKEESSSFTRCELQLTKIICKKDDEIAMLKSKVDVNLANCKYWEEKKIEQLISFKEKQIQAGLDKISQIEKQNRIDQLKFHEVIDHLQQRNARLESLMLSHLTMIDAIDDFTNDSISKKIDLPVNKYQQFSAIEKQTKLKESDINK